ncbi:copper homeostasis protein cutC homolog [Vespa velutina]|uniref:copper homeostasis protein cutC homolog n=1 Tax=Vespa velutina TaxID=202808 RepID=UPI001FB22B24|nr:copper homeostasis protein cutC homolog [Vespa velutina]XP_047346611.1 copper homeostasis protein cutC homolog [Vespa velutina]XP_047346612.1 copper homeostasis protein cutC homolog [Vespa velutina]XP_047346613.1 copper homeostasis protein cutC homolog [Vespa velutina]
MLEICVDTIESAKNAIIGGAKRLEVCSALSEGGLTPTIGLVKAIRNLTNIKIFVMLRIRSGNYIYSRDEMNAMLDDLKMFKDSEIVNGFVFGALTNDREIDILYCDEIINAAYGLPVTFHRAFDEIRDPLEGIKILSNLGFARILSSGQKDTAEEGISILQMMCKEATGKIIIMPGSGITPDNIYNIKLKTNATEFHSSARKKKKLFENEINHIKVGTVAEEVFVMVTDIHTVRQMNQIINNGINS